MGDKNFPLIFFYFSENFYLILLQIILLIIIFFFSKLYLKYNTYVLLVQIILSKITCMTINILIRELLYSIMIYYNRKLIPKYKHFSANYVEKVYLYHGVSDQSLIHHLAHPREKTTTSCSFLFTRLFKNQICKS